MKSKFELLLEGFKNEADIKGSDEMLQLLFKINKLAERLPDSINFVAALGIVFQRLELSAKLHKQYIEYINSSESKSE